MWFIHPLTSKRCQPGENGCWESIDRRNSGAVVLLCHIKMREGSCPILWMPSSHLSDSLTAACLNNLFLLAHLYLLFRNDNYLDILFRDFCFLCKKLSLNAIIIFWFPFFNFYLAFFDRSLLVSWSALHKSQTGIRFPTWADQIVSFVHGFYLPM